jgi:hypothetical protein
MLSWNSLFEEGDDAFIAQAVGLILVCIITPLRVEGLKASGTVYPLINIFFLERVVTYLHNKSFVIPLSGADGQVCE